MPQYSNEIKLQGPHKLFYYYIIAYFDMEMCHDIKICVKYDTVNVHLREKHTSLFDKMVALPSPSKSLGWIIRLQFLYQLQFVRV
jgi:hypothetical protein